VRVGTGKLVYVVSSYGEDVNGAVFVNLSAERFNVPARYSHRSIYLGSRLRITPVGI
jgi:hypothetical protein